MFNKVVDLGFDGGTKVNYPKRPIIALAKMLDLFCKALDV